MKIQHLGVNVDHVATLRQARGTDYPDPVEAALLAEQAGFRAIYLSGAGVANASFGLPDLAMTTLGDVCEDIRRISYATELPLLVDADTGWGGAFMIGRTVREMARAGAAGCHIEDQVGVKRCGHRPGKALVETAEMSDRIKAAIDGRANDDFVVMARTDAHAVEGQQAAHQHAFAAAANNLAVLEQVEGQQYRAALALGGASQEVDAFQQRERVLAASDLRGGLCVHDVQRGLDRSGGRGQGVVRDAEHVPLDAGACHPLLLVRRRSLSVRLSV